MNKVTKAEREAVYDRAVQLYQMGGTVDDVAAQLEREGVSRQRAMSAVAKVVMRQRGKTRRRD